MNNLNHVLTIPNPPFEMLKHIGEMALGLMSVVVLVWADIEDGKGGVSAGGKHKISIELNL